MTNEVKNIPELRFSGFEGEWEEKLIKDILEFENNRRKPVTSTSREIGNYPYYGASGIIDYVKDYIFNNERRLLIGEDGAKWGSFEESSFIATGRYWVNNHAHVAKSELNNLIFLNNSLNYKELRTYVTGNAPAKLTYNNLCNIPVLLPSIEEQNKIGNFFIKLDRQIELEEKKLELLEQQKRGYMQKIFSQELRFKDNNGNSYLQWKEFNFFDVLDKIIDFRGRTPKKLDMEWSTEGYLALSAINVKKGYIDFNVEAKYGDEKLYKKWMNKNELQKGQVLFTTEAPMGNVAQVPDNRGYILSQRTIAFNTNKKITNDFLASLLSTKKVYNELLRLSSGATAKGVSQKTLKSLYITIPLSIEEQQKIGNFFNKIDNLIKRQSDKIESLKERKKSLLQKMFV